MYIQQTLTKQKSSQFILIYNSNQSLSSEFVWKAFLTLILVLGEEESHVYQKNIKMMTRISNPNGEGQDGH